MISTYLYAFFHLVELLCGATDKRTRGGEILYFVLEKLEIRNNRRIFVHENTMIYHNDKY